jgi:mannosyltransferase
VYPDRTIVGLLSITVVAALLRFSTLGTHDYWLDEEFTVYLVSNRNLGGMLTIIPDSETTPPLYYLLAWAWVHLFGTSEFALRSLSALFGVGLIPVAYLAFTELVSRRVGLVVAALAAVNPFLIWHSQDARSYALVALLGAVSLLFFVRALDSPSRRSVTWWAVSSALALATHYFAVFLVATEALLLLAAHRDRVCVRWASLFLVAVGAALLPLAIHQWELGTSSWIAEIPLMERIRAAPKYFLFNNVESTSSLRVVMKLLSAGLVVLGLLLFVVRARDRERAGGLTLLSVGLPALFASLAVVVLGIDVVLPRNLIVLWLPLMGVVAVGFGSRSTGVLGPAAAVMLCALGVGLTLMEAGVQRGGPFRTQVPDLLVASDWAGQPAWRSGSEAIVNKDGNPHLVVAHGQPIGLRCRDGSPLRHLFGPIPLASCPECTGHPSPPAATIERGMRSHRPRSRTIRTSIRTRDGLQGLSVECHRTRTGRENAVRHAG